jgi:hypothetical protein
MLHFRLADSRARFFRATARKVDHMRSCPQGRTLSDCGTIAKQRCGHGRMPSSATISALTDKQERIALGMLRQTFNEL